MKDFINLSTEERSVPLPLDIEPSTKQNPSRYLIERACRKIIGKQPPIVAKCRFQLSRISRTDSGFNGVLEVNHVPVSPDAGLSFLVCSSSHRLDSVTPRWTGRTWLRSITLLATACTATYFSCLVGRHHRTAGAQYHAAKHLGRCGGGCQRRCSIQ